MPEADAALVASRLLSVSGFCQYVENCFMAYRRSTETACVLWCLLLTVSLAVPAVCGADEAKSPTAPVAAPAEQPGMKVLFNGTDLNGWDGDPRLWSVKDGVIHGETTAEAAADGNTFLICKDITTDDFELRLSFRCSAENNSGIQYRSRHITDAGVRNKWVVRGYQHEVRNQAELPNVAGFIYDEGGKRGRICLVGEKAAWEGESGKQVMATLITSEDYAALFRLNDWNDVVIHARGNHIQHYLNDRLILVFTDNDPNLTLKTGLMALQLHAGVPMWAEFRNIRIRSLK